MRQQRAEDGSGADNRADYAGGTVVQQGELGFVGVASVWHYGEVALPGKLHGLRVGARSYFRTMWPVLQMGQSVTSTPVSR